MVGRELSSFYPEKNNKIGDIIFEIKIITYLTIQENKSKRYKFDTEKR